MNVDPLERRIWWLVDSHAACIRILDEWLARSAKNAFLEDLAVHLTELGISAERRDELIASHARANSSWREAWSDASTAREFLRLIAEGRSE
jgi:hypothetical protein